MTIRIRKDRIEFVSDLTGNVYSLVETGDGFAFSGNIVTSQAFNYDTFQGTAFGYAAGGYAQPGGLDGGARIERYPFASDGASSCVGALCSGRDYNASLSSKSHGFSSGGRDPAYSTTATITKFPFATTSSTTSTLVDSFSVGYLGQFGHTSFSDGFFSGGYGPTLSSSVCRFSLSYDLLQGSVGNLLCGGYGGGGMGHSSPSHGFVVGAATPPRTAIIQKFPFSTSITTSCIGSITEAKSRVASQSSLSSGYIAAGYNGTNNRSAIEKFPFSTNANASCIGVLTGCRTDAAGTSSSTSGYTHGGEHLGTGQGCIEKFPFATDTSAACVGNLVTSAITGGAHQV
jgi:hypothetical protein